MRCTGNSGQLGESEFSSSKNDAYYKDTFFLNKCTTLSQNVNEKESVLLTPLYI
jgi:hypothetical protein